MKNTKDGRGWHKHSKEHKDAYELGKLRKQDIGFMHLRSEKEKNLTASDLAKKENISISSAREILSIEQKQEKAYSNVIKHLLDNFKHFFPHKLILDLSETENISISSARKRIEAYPEDYIPAKSFAKLMEKEREEIFKALKH